MARMHFNDGWKIWIWKNIESGCTKDEIFRILLEHGFQYDAVRSELNCDVTIPDHVGGPPFWSSVECRRASALGRIYIPGARRHPTGRGELYTLDGFLNAHECEALVELARSNLAPSRITNKDEPDKSFRTSRTCHIGAVEHPLVQDVDRRICALMGLNPSYSEALQVQYYEPGQQFKTHGDTFAPDTREFDDYGGEQGQRTWTVMVYLSDVAAGGETEFPDLQLRLAPKAGLTVIWNNLNPDGRPNPHTRHQSHPVVEGRKATMTKWFREKPPGRMHVKQLREYIPGFTPVGFEKHRIPEDVFRELSELHNKRVEGTRAAPHPSRDCRKDGSSCLVGLPDETGTWVSDRLKPLLEAWSETELVPTGTRGIQRYAAGSVVEMHTDKDWSEIISAILVIDQELTSPWPLRIEDHLYRIHEVDLAPGDMLLYEGARLKHGRPDPLDGEYCSVASVHYRPGEFNR